MRESVSSSKRGFLPFTIILIDIDYFKRVNDTYGHNVGDQLLKHVVSACQLQLSEDILFARYGGEEFVLALKGTVSEGETLANQLRRFIETNPLSTADEMISVTISCGVSEATFGTGETLHQLLHKADEALYSAKRAGRNQVHVHNKKAPQLWRDPVS